MYNLTDESSDEFESLDTSWIERFDNIDNEYKIYYCEDISFINFQFIYINYNNEIQKLKEDRIILKEPSKIKKEDLVSLIKHNQVFNNNKYNLLFILKFNINIEPMHLKTFLKSKTPNIGNIFLQQIHNIDSIKLDKSISMFHDLNSIIVILKQKDKLQTNKSKKVIQNSHNKTKKLT